MKLSKLSILYRSLEGIGRFFFIIFISGWASFSSLDTSLLIIVLIVISTFGGLFSLLILYQYLYWKNYEYWFYEGHLNIKKGVLRKESREIPLRRIQNIDIKKNIVQRILGIAQVNFETAGGSETEAELRYARVDDVPVIQKKVKGLETVTEEKEEREPFFALNPQELALMSLISMDKKVFGALIGLLSIVLGESITTFAEGLGTYTIPLFFSGLFFVAWGGSAVATYFKFYGFKLWKSEDVLEYERGLLNRYNGSIPLKKIQTLGIEENPLKRILGYATLKVETAGYAKKTSKEKGSEVAIPLADREAILGFADSLQDFSTLSLNKIPKRARKRYALRYGIIFVLFITMMYLVNHFLIEFNYWYFFILTPLVIPAAHYEWVHKGYGLGEDHFFARRGYWNRKTLIVPYYRIQNLIEKRTFIQQRWNLSSLILDTASTGRGTEAIASDISMKVSGKLQEEVFRRFRNSI